jgi:nucleotide-binding universal stress UspA family protein
LPSGPIVIGYDGSSASEHALREAGPLLSPRQALVVVVWEAGAAFQLAALPNAALDMPLAPIDVRTAMEIDRKLYEGAQRLAEHGAALARELGFEAEALAVADEASVPETLVGVARERAAAAIVVGAHSQGAFSEVLLGSTSRGVVHRATCPVVVVREAPGEGG